MRRVIVLIIVVGLTAAGAPAHGQIGFTLPFGDSGSGGGLWIGPGGGRSMKSGGGKVGEPKSAPVRTPQFKPATPKPPIKTDLTKAPLNQDLTKAPLKTDLTKASPKLDLGKAPLKTDFAKPADKPDLGKTTPRLDLGKANDKPTAGDKATDKTGGAKTFDQPAANGSPPPGDAKTTDQIAKGARRTDDRRDGDRPKGDDKLDTGVTLDGGPIHPPATTESGGAIVEAGPPSRPVRYVAPLPNARCGPDVTEQVLAILRDMARQFHDNPGKQGEACRTLVSPFSGANAWDINGLDPETGGKPGHYEEPPAPSDWGSWIVDKFGGLASPFRPKGKWVPGSPGTWLTSVSDACAIPRPYPVCAATVEFLGTCQHAQIVNYAMWGMVMGLCDETGTGATHALGDFWRGARNLIKSYGTPPDQELMVKVGERYHNFVHGAGDGPPPDTEELANWLQFEDDRADHPERACPLHCDLTELQKRKIKVAIPGFDWEGLNR